MLINKVKSLITEMDSFYFSVSLSKATAMKLNNLIKKYNVPNPVKKESFHISLFTTPNKIKIPKGIYDIKFDINDMKNFTIMTWYSNKKENPDKRLMVLEFSSYELNKFRNHLINTLQIPVMPLINKFHITLSYNIGSKKSYPITKDLINPFPIEISSLKIC